MAHDRFRCLWWKSLHVETDVHECGPLCSRPSPPRTTTSGRFFRVPSSATSLLVTGFRYQSQDRRDMSRTTRLTPLEGLRSRLRAERLIQNAAALMLSTGGTALLGLVFWTSATHLATAAAVGRTSAEIAAMVLIANLAQLSFGSIFE